MRKDPLRFALEVNPWTPVDDLREFTLMRGVIVGAWASVETTLKELALKCHTMDCYSAADRRVPFKNKDLILYFRLVLEADGPLSKYSDDFSNLLELFVLHSQDRHMLAHAHMSVLPNWGAVFKSYAPRRDKDGADYYVYEERRITLEQMEEMARAASRLSHEAQAIRQDFLADLE